jgi:hypothetical protein
MPKDGRYGEETGGRFGAVISPDTISVLLDDSARHGLDLEGLQAYGSAQFQNYVIPAGFDHPQENLFRGGFCSLLWIWQQWPQRYTGPIRSKDKCCRPDSCVEITGQTIISDP